MALQKGFSQDEDYSKEPVKKNDKPTFGKFTDRLVFGGGAGFQFGTETNITLMQKAGYYVNDNFLVGAGFTYIYYKVNYDQMYGYGGTFKTSLYGASLFADYFIMENFIVHFEPELLNFEFKDLNTGYTDRSTLSSFFIGAGYRSKISNKGFVELLLLYNLNYKENSPYSSPFVPRISFFPINLPFLQPALYEV